MEQPIRTDYTRDAPPKHAGKKWATEHLFLTPSPLPSPELEPEPDVVLNNPRSKKRKRKKMRAEKKKLEDPKPSLPTLLLLRIWTMPDMFFCPRV